ncbi:hypothetical protein M569_11615 [Genlisea aurea]|uniref:Uncharacterized protein n=1 Tax=Genlisea aurea TaxID=192259 RepID=S8DTM7_9LAMI|nr:hypothetical protein M569_11615 [Genlisea aurea]
MVALCLTAAVTSLHPPHCSAADESCVGATPLQMAVLLFSFGLMIVGAGGVRPCNFAFGADQFNPKTDSGKAGVDSFFNWYYFTVSLAQIISVTLVVYVQSSISWSIGFGIPAVFMLLASVLFFAGSDMYVKVKPEGSPFTSLLKVAVVAVKNRRLKPPYPELCNYTPMASMNSTLSRTDQYRFLDKAAVVTKEEEVNFDGSPAKTWRLCSVQQVEEAKCVLRILPILLTVIVYTIGVNPQYMVFQALQSDRRLPFTDFQIPAATFSIFAMLSLTLWIPIYDRVIMPQMRRIRRGQGLNALHRIGFGILITVIESLVAGAVEGHRKASATPMSAMWFVPQLLLGGVAEAFYAIGLIEFFYKEFPENMRSLAGASYFVGNALGNYSYSLLITVVHRLTKNSSGGEWLPEDLNKGRLDYFYYFLAGLCSMNFLYFYLCEKSYRYKATSGIIDSAKLDHTFTP